MIRLDRAPDDVTTLTDEVDWLRRHGPGGWVGSNLKHALCRRCGLALLWDFGWDDLHGDAQVEEPIAYEDFVEMFRRWGWIEDFRDVRGLCMKCGRGCR